MRKKVLLHEEMKTLRMRSGQPQVFVEIEAAGLREIEIAGAVQRNQFFVEPQWSAAGGQAQNNCGIGTNRAGDEDRKSTRLNSSHQIISYAVFCLKKKKTISTK